MPVKVLISTVKDSYEWLVSGLVHLLSNDPFRRTGLMPCTFGTRQPRATEVHQGKGQSKVPCHCLPGGHIQGHWEVFTVVPGSEGLRVVPHLPCTRQPLSCRSTKCSTP